ncbi:LOW QUALITY PROTEIN: protein phosphatase PHLPP-like protein [Homalodisca vitripennis]|uniref:LOW QUALITY PROTEIN: protein phosphatase PHLPP-like protein n=1 Tax=Homalodisca vitripennis TaxID=197043 RepID=UPI001EEAE591|nr:LOW QUALITY PROTEIN: protein phosphatase PHLPP-like protein [Homalodisca vitripennis]
MEELVLSGNQLLYSIDNLEDLVTVCYSCVSAWQEMEELVLSGNQLLYSIDNLEDLVTVCYSCVSAWQEMEELVLSGNQLLYSIDNLEDLVTVCYSCVSAWQEMEELVLSGNQLLYSIDNLEDLVTVCYSCVSAWQEMEELVLSGNQLLYSIDNLEDLVTVCYSCVSAWQEMEELVLSGNQLLYSIDNLEDLVTVCYSCVSAWQEMEELVLSGNQLLYSIDNLEDLVTVCYSCVSAWQEMEELVLSGNQLCQLPENMTRLAHLRVLRMHSNLLRSCPGFGSISALRVLDLAHNQLDRVNLATLVSQRLQFLDISGNTRLHVDAKQFQAYRTQRTMSLVDVSGQNRNCLPSSPPHQEVPTADLDSPWTLGFSETPGNRDRLCIAQLRLPGFCNTEALLGLFDAGNSSELPQLLVKTVPRILLEERTVKETAADYMKYTMLSAHRELKEMGQRCGMCAVLCHISRQKVGGPRRYVLRIASVGEAKALLSRTSGSLTLAHASTQQPVRSQLGNSAMFPMVVPDPHVTEVVLSEQDEFLIIANKSLWEVVGVQEAVKLVRPVTDAVLAAKRLQDTAQSYGCEENLSVLVLRFHSLRLYAEPDPFVRELRSTLRKAASQVDMLCEDPEGEGDRSSPSGQSDQASSGRPPDISTVQTRHYVADKNDLIMPRQYQSVLMHENGTRKMTPNHKGLDLYSNGNLADGEETSSERSTQLSEEQFRCWEYMLEQNTQLLFDKELDTLSRGFVRRSVPSRPTLWPRAKSNPALNEQPQPPFLSRHFGSARSFHPIPNRPLAATRSLHGGPNAAYFGSLQRLMPYHLEYDFSVIKERLEPNVDSLEQDGGRMHKYWDVATTEL